MSQYVKLQFLMECSKACCKAFLTSSYMADITNVFINIFYIELLLPLVRFGSFPLVRSLVLIVYCIRDKKIWLIFNLLNLFLEWTFWKATNPLSVLEIWSWSVNSIEPRHTAQMCRLACLYTDGKVLSHLAPSERTRGVTCKLFSSFA